MKAEVSVIDLPKAEYPTQDYDFRPGTAYPEYIFQNDISPEPNIVYEAVREALYELSLDRDNFGKRTWNPFCNLVKKGDTVLIKPNLVMDRNPNNEDTECLYTHPSVVAPIIDYVALALNGTGRIILADAPMQECNFERLISQSGYKRLVQYYINHGIPVELIDLRDLSSVVKNGVYTFSAHEESTGIIVDLARDSVFQDGSCDYRITNYDPNELKKHHNQTKHEYDISKYVLEADVFINVPKPKCHRKAGATMACKNVVGINARKEYLPHHTKGSIKQGGDEYLKTNLLQRLRSYMMDKKNIFSKQGKRNSALLLRYGIKALEIILKSFNEKYFEGSWYGNHTISKTISDLNRILLYADKNGIMRETTQRRVFAIADMVISGEKEGPLYPSRKEAKKIVASREFYAMDVVIATLMGFDINKIPTLKELSKETPRYAVPANMPVVVSNLNDLNGCEGVNIPDRCILSFVPSDGWKGHIELD